MKTKQNNYNFSFLNQLIFIFINLILSNNSYAYNPVMAAELKVKYSENNFIIETKPFMKWLVKPTKEEYKKGSIGWVSVGNKTSFGIDFIGLFGGGEKSLPIIEGLALPIPEELDEYSASNSYFIISGTPYDYKISIINFGCDQEYPKSLLNLRYFYSSAVIIKSKLALDGLFLANDDLIINYFANKNPNLLFILETLGKVKISNSNFDSKKLKDRASFIQSNICDTNSDLYAQLTPYRLTSLNNNSLMNSNFSEISYEDNEISISWDPDVALSPADEVNKDLNTINQTINEIDQFLIENEKAIENYKNELSKMKTQN